MKNDNDITERRSSLIDRLLRSDVAKKIADDARAEELAAREHLIRARAATFAERDRHLHDVHAREADALAEEREGFRAWETKRIALEDRRREASQAATGFDVRLDRIEAALRHSADPRISLVSGRLERIAQEVTSFWASERVPNSIPSGRPTTVESTLKLEYPDNDARQRGELAQEIRQAARAVLALAIEALTVEALTGKLWAIWRQVEERAAALGVRLPMQLEIPLPPPWWEAP